jgi:hypothetical protein
VRHARLNDLASGYKLVLGLGAATSLAAGALLFVGAPGGSRPPHSVHSRAASVNRTLAASAAVSTPAKSARPTPTSAQLPPAQAVLITAKFARLSATPLGGDEGLQAAPPAAPEVVGVEAPAAQAAPAPQPMQAAVQTAEAPAAVAPPPAPAAKVSYFGGGSTSVQHLPTASH